MVRDVFFPCAALALSYVLTGLVRGAVLSRGILDYPNERSSHKIPTPRGGGIALVLTASMAFASLALIGALPLSVVMALVGGGVAIAVVGFLDDRGGLSAASRLVVHFAAAGWALAWLGNLPPVQVGEHLIVFGWAGYLLGAVGIVWILNLFNFMDGIDGIAASEAIFVTVAGAILTGAAGGAMLAMMAFAAACAGFLVWNWPPARIFLGDVGSGYIGYTIAVFALIAAEHNVVALPIWLILGGVFFVDATVTLARRLARRERVYEAHRSHGYQQLASRCGSHLRVTSIVLGLNMGLLLPSAGLVVAYPSFAIPVLICVLALLISAAFYVGAGNSVPGRGMPPVKKAIRDE